MIGLTIQQSALVLPNILNHTQIYRTVLLINTYSILIFHSAIVFNNFNVFINFV